ncbi:MAG: hypothetical protein GVY18_01615, partial [Bacteroidetes bacterium]|nr:hypothetical protein [Bacteroidota bacterium]
MLRRSLFALLVLCAPLLVQAQVPECGSSKYQQQTICPGQSGAALLQCLQAYRPADSQMLDYRDARDQMYGWIDNQGGSVTGVYSGFTVTGVPQDPAVEPRTDAFNKGINTEHTWPQSLGIGGDDPGARSNMHHLFPTRIQVNSARGNLPLLERDDDTETDDWYRNAQELSSKPSSNLDSYSERDVNNGFEPRELHEGNAARALFYVWTVYGDLVGSQSSFFEAMKDDLRTWHEIDPPDQAEFARTCAIAEVQDDKVNPFVIDPTLVDRAFFGEPGQEGDVQITAVERSAFIPDADAPLTITATVSSTLALAQVEVRYTVDGTDQPPVAMTSSGGEAFAGTIPASAYADGSRVRYRVYAEDDTGVSDMSNEAVFFAGTTPIAQLTQTDVQGQLLFDGAPARVAGVVQAEAGVFAADEAYLEDVRGLRLTGTTTLTDRERRYVVAGTMQQDDGQAELDVQSVVSAGDIQPTPPPAVTLAELLDDAEAFEGRLVRVVDVQQIDGAFPASGDG